MRRVFFDFFNFLGIVERDERLVLIQLFQRLDSLGGVGVDDFVPNPILPFLRRQMPDVLIDVLELRHGRDVETRARLIKRLYDLRVGVGLHRVVGLDARQVFFEHRVIGAQFVVINHEQRRAVSGGQFLQGGFGNHFSNVKQPGRFPRSGGQ